MSKKAIQSDNYKYTVVQEPLKHNGKLLRYYGNFRTDTDECLGITTDQYGLIQNEDLIDATRAALEVRGLKGFSERVVVSGKGEKMFAEFTFKERQLATNLGDILGYKMILRNSFDRTIRGSIVLGFLRLACLNGMTTLEKDFSVTRKHSGEVSVKFVGDAIDRALTHGDSALKVFDNLANVGISDEQGMNILAHLERAKTLSGKLVEGIKVLWLKPKRVEDKARTLYSLYNAVTEYLTHEVAKERYEYSQQTSTQVLFKLANASSNPDRLAQLILPVPEDGVSIKVDADPIAEASGAGSLIVT